MIQNFLAFSVQAQQSFYLQAVQLLKTNRLYRSPPLPLSLPPRNLPLLLHLRIFRTILCLNSKPGPKNPRTATITLKCMKKTAMCTAWMMTPCCTDFYQLSPATQKACTAPAEPLFSFRPVHALFVILSVKKALRYRTAVARYRPSPGRGP